MAINSNLDRESNEVRGRFVEGARATYGADPDIELVGTMEIHASDVMDIALDTTSEVVPTRAPDIELVGTGEVSPRPVPEAPTPSQLLGEGEHEETAVVDWRNFSEPPDMPAARPAAGSPAAAAARLPVQREPAGKAPVAPVVAAATNGRAARPVPVRGPAPERELSIVPAPAPQASAGTGSAAVDTLTASSVLAGQYAVLTEVVVAMLTAMPDRDAVLCLALRNAERMRDFPPGDATVAMWQEGVDRELENFRDLAAGLKHRKSL